MKNKQKKNVHIQWILVGLLFGLYGMYLKRVRNIYPRNMYTGLWVSFVFRLSPTTMSALTCNIWQNTYEPIFPKTRAYPCIGYAMCTQSNIFEHNDFKLFQVEVTSVTSVQRSEWNVTESVALLFQRLDYTRLKGKNQIDFEPFYSV